MMITPSPRSRRRWTSSRTCAVCTTPSAHARQRGHAERVEELDRLLLHRLLVESPRAVQQLAAQEQVRDDVEVVAEREILVDGRDPVLVGGGGAADVRALAVDRDRARVRGLDPGDRLDQRRLAGAVVADQGDDLAGVDLEVDVDERLDTAEALADAGGTEQGLRTHSFGIAEVLPTKCRTRGAGGHPCRAAAGTWVSPRGGPVWSPPVPYRWNTPGWCGKVPMNASARGWILGA